MPVDSPKLRIPFLTAHWQDLVVVNFEVDPNVLSSYVPRGTELDFFGGKAFLSLVAFRFNRTRLFGLIPSFPHYSFDEVNLRFYVTRNGKRGVTFIKEVVPSKLIASTARLLYQEPYVALRTSSEKVTNGNYVTYTYKWDTNLDCKISVRTDSVSLPLEPGSIEEFILEHYWGYTAQADASTVEYHVQHPRWTHQKVLDYELSESIANFYGEDFRKVLSRKPSSAFVAVGSSVSVSPPTKYFHPLLENLPKGWVLYDGLCGFCTWWIPFWRKTIQKTGYDTALVQSQWVKEKLPLKEAELNNDIRLLLNDGTLINGADAYLYGMKKVWWSSPVGWALGLPFFRQLTWACYKVFNRKRFLVSRVCRMKSELEK